jgi:hypothetical protein
MTLIAEWATILGQLTLRSTMSTIYISGYLAANTPFNYEIRPSSIDTVLKLFADDVRGLDGSHSRYHRGSKYEFSITFTNIQENTVNSLRNIFSIPGEYHYQHEDGSIYTVFTEMDSFKYGLQAQSVSLRGIKLYTLSIGLCEV